MARVEVEIAGNAKGLTGAFNEAASGAGKLEGAIGGASRKIDGATKSLGNANGVAAEFSRIIQDAPYGMIGIGNNLQQLTANFSQTAQAAGGFGAALRMSLVSLVSPANLLVLGVAAVTSGLAYYQMQTQKSAKATKDLADAQTKAKEENDRYVASLNQIAQAHIKGAEKAAEEMATLRILYQRSQDVTVAYNERKRAVDEMQQQYPDYFKNIKDEVVLAGGAQAAYDKLSTSILATARARAGAGLIAESAARQMVAEQRVTDLQQGQQQVTAELQKQMNLAKSFSERIEISGQIDRTRVGVNKEIARLQGEINKEKRIQLQLDQKINSELNRGGSLTTTPGNSSVLKAQESERKKAETEAERAAKRLQEALKDSANSVDLVGLDKFDAQIAKVKQKYAEYYDAAKGNSDALRQLRSNEANEISAIAIEKEQYISSEVLRIRNEAGIKTALSRDKELAQIYKWYNDQVAKAQENQEILQAIREAGAAMIDSVNEKYLKKERDLWDKINTIQSQANAVGLSKEESQSERIISEWEKRKKALIEYYAELKRLSSSDPSKSTEVKNLENSWLNRQKGAATASIDAAVEIDIDKKHSEAVGKELTQGLNRATRQFASNFYSTLTSLNMAADRSFAGIFSTLTAGLNNAMNEIFLNTFTQLLKTQLEKGVREGTSGMGGEVSRQMQIAAAGVGLLGGVISGATKKTSYAGQAAGGALSGAATGAVIGSAIPGIGTVVGGVVGGVIGAIGGLFGAGKARKEERRQAELLAEQKKQTALMERANALAYSSSIIGKMVDGLGVVNSVELNEFGQLKAVVSGQDLQFILDRNAKNR